ncbi:MAG: linear amide C-N hydrolase [Gammaproteobacteria bacterium]
MKNLRISLTSLTLLVVLSFCNIALACTDFRIIAKDGTVLITRSLEFAMDMKSNLRSSPRGRVFNTKAPDGKPGLSWKAKYGYVSLDGFNIDAAIDGMNEVGLSIEDLYLPALAQYQVVPKDQSSQALPYVNLGDWILGNFQSVDEVRQALPTVYVFANKIPTMGDTVFPLHFSIFDSTGKGIVVEYVEGKLHIYDNIGVMTNSPSYDWHLTNLMNYLHLAPVNPSPLIVNGITYAANGQGFGMIGLPGDISPPSRFVKTATLLRVALQADDSASALNEAEHIINNVDIVRGEAREPESGKFIDETTQWVVFKDLTHKIFYYRTYGDMSLRAVSLSKVNFAEGAPRLLMPIARKENITDLTGQFIKSTAK